MKKAIVCLAKQSQPDGLLREWEVVRVAVHRIGKREWIPFIDIRNDTGQACTCPSRVRKGMEPGRWSVLRAWVDWIDTRMGVKASQRCLPDSGKES